jgi:hypothetical protein
VAAAFLAPVLPFALAVPVAAPTTVGTETDVCGGQALVHTPCPVSYDFRPA